MALAPGTRIADYTVLKKLGEGGMGEVYLCVHAKAGRQVVVKGLRAFHKGNKDLRSRFAREAEVMARLKHPNIVGIYNFLETDEGAFIVMEYVDGVSFDDVLVKRGALSPADAAELLKPVLAAVHFAHEQGVIHRDLKPSNFMLGFDDHVRVLDFGTAKLVDQPGLTRAGTTLGTANYMPPEQLLGKDLGPQADVYALGVCLYEMTTGRLPFEAETTSELIGAIVINEPAPPTRHAPSLPKLFEELILRCLAKQPQDRFATVEALGQALDDVLAATGLAKKPEPKEPPVTAPPPPSAAPVATQKGPIGRARFEPGPLPTRADVSMAKMVGFAGVCSMAAGALLLWHGTVDAGLAAVCAAAVLTGASLHLASRNTLRLLDVVGQAVITARSAEEEAKTLAAKLALSAPVAEHARPEAAPAPAPAPTGFEAPSGPAGGTRRLFASDVMPAVGESLPGADANAEKRRARTDVWRYAPLDGAAAAAVASAAGGGGTEVLSPEAVAKALAEAQSHSQAHGGGGAAAPARVRTTGVVEVDTLIPPELRSEYAAAAGIALPPQQSTTASGRTAVASLSEIRKILKDAKTE